MRVLGDRFSSEDRVSLQPRPTRGHDRAALFIWGSVLFLGCGPALDGAPVCSPSTPCRGDQRCVVGRCREPDTQPVNTVAPRLELAPRELAAFDAQGELLDTTLTGGEGAVRSLWLRLDAPTDLPSSIQRAVIVVWTGERCGRHEDVRVEAAPIDGAWTRDGSSSPPSHTGFVEVARLRPAPSTPIRIDVSELAREAAEGTRPFFGFGLRFSPSSLCLATGDGPAPAPFVDVYLKVEEEADEEKEKRAPPAKEASPLPSPSGSAASPSKP